MSGKVFFAAIIAATAFGLSACDRLEELAAYSSLPACESERNVEGWNVSTLIGKPATGPEIYDRWETRRNFSAHFGVRIVYDTSEGPTPFLQIWHDYKSGEFLMRLDGDAHFRLFLKDQFSVSSGALPPEVFELISRRPVRIEYTSNTNKWSVYETEGLPEAIAAAQVDLETVKQYRADKKCRT